MKGLAVLLDHSIRRRIEESEFGLSPLGAKSRYSLGRPRPDEPSPMRTCFQVDRDRIIHCKAFRRLKHKTQVFIAPLGDHYITRLTHTLQVAQIARSIARALNLNEDLAEAIALCHDLGHPPFGHAGEEALDEVFPGGFRHNEQTLRVVDCLENDGRGLNLTWEVRDALLKHSKGRASVLGAEWGVPSTLEGQVVKLADSVAYINHDIDDAIRAGLISTEDLPQETLALLGRRHSQRINTMVCDAIAASWEAVRAGDDSRGQSEQEYRRLMAQVAEEADGGRSLVAMSPPVLTATNTLREFMFQRVYFASGAIAEVHKAMEVVKSLYRYFCQHPEAIPEEFAGERLRPSGEGLRQEPIERLVCDYVSGMTDRYALKTFEELFMPKLWSVVG